MKRTQLRAEILSRLLLLTEQLLQRARQARQAVKYAVPSIIIARKHAKQREGRLLGLDRYRFGGCVEVGDAGVNGAFEQRSVRRKRLDVGCVVAVNAGICKTAR
jgi:hypothetical protein